MSQLRTTNAGSAAAKTTTRPSPGLRVAMTVLIALALAVGFATARAQTAAGTSAAADGWSGYENQPYRVNIWHDRAEDEIYQRGEAVRIHFEANHDAYAVVYRIDAEGAVSILWPRSRFDDGFVFGHHTYNLPTPGAERIRTADEEGVEYVQVIVSAYPFDLRGLEVDFHHERGQDAHAYYVAGDPFLAMNDVNYAVTGLDDPSDYVVTNYLSYYVHRQVDHPRYMCTQCHDDNVSYHPYDDVCVIEIHHDYSWDNGWYDRYHYYPAYYYPVYYYVDPWTWRPWINPWYRPWYAWPTWGGSVWGFDCYLWNHSPYWRGDVWARYKQGDRRYRPIDKNHRYADNRGDAVYKYPGNLVKTPRPTSEMVTSMERKKVLRKTDVDRSEHRVAVDRNFRNTERTVKPVTGFVKQPRDVRAPGIQVPRTEADGSPLVRPGPITGREGRGVTRTVKPSIREGQSADRVAPARQRTKESAVRPVSPHNQGSRIWQGGSRDQKSGRTVKPRTGGEGTTSRKPQAVKPKREADKPTRKAPATRSRSGSDGSSSRKSQSVKPSSSKSSSSRSSSSVKPRSSGGSSTKSSGSSGSRSSSSSSRSKGGGKTSSNRGAKR